MNPSQFFSDFTELKKKLRERISNNFRIKDYVTSPYNEWSYNVHKDSIYVSVERPFRCEYDEMFDCTFSVEDLQSDEAIDECIRLRYREGRRDGEWFWCR